MKQRVAFNVNLQERELLVDTHRTLAEVLREDLGLTGTKEPCALGTCGACTVLLDGVPVLSCLILAASCEGRAITTIEGLASDGRLTKVQQAFIDQGAIQCGMCSPGMILCAEALLQENAPPSKAEVEEAISGNVCRCTGYHKIVEAVLVAAEASHE
jgi:carbon-monoxide dehydrogenase small subunit